MKWSLFTITLHETPANTCFLDSLIRAYTLHFGTDSSDEIDGLIDNLTTIFQFLVRKSVWYHETPVVTFDCFLDGHCLIFEFKDKALPWRQSQLRQDAKTAVLKNQPLFIDRLELFNLGKNGRLLQIKKSILPLPKPQEKNKQTAGANDHQITYRQLTPQESDKAVDCMVVAYGYDYGIPDVYHVEQTKQFMEEGLVYTLAAETENKDIAGISTLRKRHQSSNIADLCQTMVDPRFMQKKLFENLLSGVIEIAEHQLQCQGLSATIPNKHYVSQKKLNRLGFKPTGILLGCVPAIVMPKQLGTHHGDRESFLLVYKPLRELPFETIYVPEPHIETMAQICHQLDFHTTVSLPPFIDLPNKTLPSSQFKIHEVENLNWAIIEVQSCGSDIIDCVVNTLDGLKMRRFRAIQLYLDLNDPIAVSYISQFESMDFFFSGFFPDEKPYLVLQRLESVSVDFEDLDLPMPGANFVQAHIEAMYQRMQRSRRKPHTQEERLFAPQSGKQ